MADIKQNSLLLCRDIISDQQTGLISLINVVDGIESETFPVNTGNINLFGQFEVIGHIDDNEIDIQVGFFNEADESLKEPSIFKMPFNQEDDKQRTGVLITIDNLVFPSEGRYTIKVTNDSKVIGELDIVAKVEK